MKPRRKLKMKPKRKRLMKLLPKLIKIQWLNKLSKRSRLQPNKLL
jgi:hypothetical protein